jgi:hypothetical protein
VSRSTGTDTESLLMRMMVAQVFQFLTLYAYYCRNAAQDDIENDEIDVRNFDNTHSSNIVILNKN